MANAEIVVYFDGDCPLCMREIRFLQKLDRHARVGFVDIAASDFDMSEMEVSWETLMERIHGRLPDGTLIEGVEVFRRLYSAVGFRRTVRATRLPGISHGLDAAYQVFAKRRLQLTGRCVDGACAVPSTPRAAGAK